MLVRRGFPAADGLLAAFIDDTNGAFEKLNYYLSKRGFFKETGSVDDAGPVQNQAQLGKSPILIIDTSMISKLIERANHRLEERGRPIIQPRKKNPEDVSICNYRKLRRISRHFCTLPPGDSACPTQIPADLRGKCWPCSHSRRLFSTAINRSGSIACRHFFINQQQWTTVAITIMAVIYHPCLRYLLPFLLFVHRREGRGIPSRRR
jgi:hypothetical protein